MGSTVVSLVCSSIRSEAVTRCIGLLDGLDFCGMKVLIKPNFNTADPAPGSTHNDTLGQLIREIRRRGAKDICVGERSGPVLTRDVVRQKRVQEVLTDLDVTFIDFDTLLPEDWVFVRYPGTHWKDGFRVARPILEADSVVGTCCLKTHQYGGVFSMSLKLAVTSYQVVEIGSAAPFGRVI
ncbi:MAG: DUF362 domain-containing protein [Bacillota bacterium]